MSLVRLELTPGQTEWLRPVLMEHFKAQTAVLDRHDIKIGKREDGKRPRFRALSRMDKELDANNVKTRERLSSILPDSQLAAYETFRAEQRKRLRSQLLQR